MNSSSARISDARVATPDQNTEARIAALEAAGCTMIRTETGSGSGLESRPELGITRKWIAEFNCHFRRQYSPRLPWCSLRPAAKQEIQQTLAWQEIPCRRSTFPRILRCCNCSTSPFS